MKKALLLFSALLVLAQLSQAQQFPVDTLMNNGPMRRQINLVFLADGYQASEQAQFIVDATRVMNDMFSQTPFREYRSYFNVYAVRVPSAQSGATHARSLTDCGTQPAATVNNYFGSSFDSFGIHRLLVPTRNIGAVLASNLPLYDQAFILVNSAFYGGSGGVNATSSTHPSANEVSIHEIGHSFAGLSDEYWAGPQYARETANMTQQTNPAVVRWANWMNTGGVGIYPYIGGPNNWFHPHQNCKMQNLGAPFCPVCRETFVERIHSLQPPLASYQPAALTVNAPTQDLPFALSLVQPNPNTLKVTWKRNGTIFRRNAGAVNVPLASLAAGSNTIQAEIVDTTALTRNNTHFVQHVYRVEWVVNNTVTGVRISAEQSEYKIAVFPNPAGQFLNVEYKLPRASKVELAVYDLNGRKIKSLTRETQAAGSYEYHLSAAGAGMQRAGQYLLVLDINGSRASRQITKE
ncbi:M64 family metallo-endopeptidase [Hymenobacter sp. BT175]|uniref:M64 family metallopeptidase n=1 Tax=Hymenobacter translucens TaxID=2886507 RepID=UPI001D0E0E22|nr:M64 family metallopeptidase [Hymenobacter translucens]MCC2548022.1 M64 family metallo-endopeptidase [Hymenobacter translucens]